MSSIGFDYRASGSGDSGGGFQQQQQQHSSRIAVSQYVAAPLEANGIAQMSPRVSERNVSPNNNNNPNSQYGSLAVHPIQHSDGALAFASPLGVEDEPGQSERKVASQYAEFVPDRESKAQMYVVAPGGSSPDLF